MQTTNQSSLSKVSAEVIFRFIKLYKGMESVPLKDGYAWIKLAIGRNPEKFHLVSHLCDHWRWKNRCFGEFWMNLDVEIQILFLQCWNFNVEGADTYLEQLRSNPISALFIPHPPLVKALHDVVMYFENHPIENHPTPDLTLTWLPPADKQYGSASNWGSYLLGYGNTLTYECSLVIKTIREHYPNHKKA
jgi:hypothetical protein